MNGLGGRIEIVETDLRTYEPGRSFDLIFSNPPYIRASTGFLSASAEKSAAKHELHGAIGEILGKTAAWLAPEGRASFVYPEKRRTDFLAAAGGRAAWRSGACDSSTRGKGEPPNLFLVELGHARGERKAAGEEAFGEGTPGPPNGSGQQPELMPPLILFGPDGKYTAAAEEIFSGT